MNDLAFEPLMEVLLRLALTPEHRITKLRRVPLKRLEEERFIIFKKSAAPPTHNVSFAGLPISGPEPNMVKQCDRAQSILDLVAAGMGVAIVSEQFQRYRTRTDFPAMHS